MIGFTKTIGLAALVACSMAGAASAALITAGFENSDSEKYGDVATDTYRENGLNFEVLSGHFEIVSVLGLRSDTFHVDDGFYGPPVIEITYDGGLFDLVSFEGLASSSQTVAVFASNLGDTFDAANSPGLNLFPTTFKGIRSITLFSNYGAFEFDNFTISDRITDSVGMPSPVPLPATLPLLALALGGLGFGARRRKASRV